MQRNTCLAPGSTLSPGASLDTKRAHCLRCCAGEGVQVDDLVEIDGLEELVQASSAMVILLGSAKYFSSTNCLREVASAKTAEVQPILVSDIEESKGGAPVSILMTACPQKYRDYVFGPTSATRPVIAWHRLQAFQLVSLAQIAEQMLLTLPSYTRSSSLPLYIPRALPWVLPESLRHMSDKVAGSPPVPLFTYPCNAQANQVAAKVRDFSGRASGGLPSHSSPPIGEESSVRWLLFVDSATFKGESGQQFAEEVHAALIATHVAPVVVYSPEHNAFQQIIEETPGKLKQAGLYGPLAIEWRSGAHEDVSVRMVARALLGSPARLRGRWDSLRTRFRSITILRQAVRVGSAEESTHSPTSLRGIKGGMASIAAQLISLSRRSSRRDDDPQLIGDELQGSTLELTVMSEQT